MNDHRTRLITEFYRDDIPEKYKGIIAESKAAKEAERKEKEAIKNLPDPGYRRRWLPDPEPRRYHRRVSGQPLFPGW